MDAARGLAGLAASLLRRLLAHPLTASLDLDDPSTTELRRKIIASKPFLKSIYNGWYSQLAAAVPSGKEAVVELGWGTGFCFEFIPGLITSDVFPGRRGAAESDTRLHAHRVGSGRENPPVANVPPWNVRVHFTMQIADELSVS